MRSGLSIIATGLWLFLAPSMANASTIYACKKQIGGTIRIVGAQKVCLATETKMSWPDTAEIASLQALVTTSQAQVDALQDLLQHFTRDGDDISITGANLWIKSGSGYTEGVVNGRGNLIVGYNEMRLENSGYFNVRTGSHNVIIGACNNYTSHGGLVVGFFNSVSGEYSSVSGGVQNIASGKFSSVSGGGINTASGEHSSVSGGIQNIASGKFSSVSGGLINTASGEHSSVSGGTLNIASGDASSVSGGSDNTASVLNSSVSGGNQNIASGGFSSVSGGRENIASGVSSSVSGGFGRSALEYKNWAAGTLYQDQ